MCIYDLIKHMKQKVQEKQKLQKIANGQEISQEDHSDNNLINEKILPSGMKKERKNDDSITQDDFQDQNKQDIYNMLNDKQLIMNGVDPLRVTKNRQQNNLQQSEDFPDMKLAGSGVHKKRAQNRRNRRSKFNQKNPFDSPDKNSDEALGDSQLLSDAILIKDLKGNNKYKRNISNESKDHLLLQQGVLKDVTKDKYKRTDLAKIPSRHEAQDEIDQFDQLDRQNNRRNGNNKDIPQGNFKQINNNPKKMKELQDLQSNKSIQDANLVQRKGRQGNNQIREIPVIERENKKKHSMKDQQNNLQDLVGIKKDGKHKTRIDKQIQDLKPYDVSRKKRQANNDDNAEINQGKYKERNSNKKQDQSLNQFKEDDKTRKIDDKKLRQGKMKERQGEAFGDFEQLLASNKGEKNIPDGNLKQRGKKLETLQEKAEEDIQNGKFKQRQRKNKPVNNFFENDNQYENQGVMVDRQGKKKKNVNNLAFQQEKDVEQVRMYENTGNKYKRNLNNQPQQNQRDIDANTYDANTKKKIRKTGEQNRDQKGVQQGRFVQHQSSSRDRPQNNKYFGQTEQIMKQARTAELRTKKIQKQQKKGFFDNFFNKQPEMEQAKVQEKKPQQSEDFQESDMGKRRSKRHSRREQKKNAHLNQQGDLQQSYEDIVRKNKQNMIMPETNKGKGFMSMKDEGQQFEDSQYKKSPRKGENDSRPKSRDRGLGVNDRGSDSQGDDTVMGPRRQRSSSKQRQRKLASRLHLNNNDDSSDVGDEQMSPETRRKKKQNKEKRSNKSGILQINGRDNEVDDGLDSIQL